MSQKRWQSARIFPVLTAVALLLGGGLASSAQTLPITATSQQQDEWCWAATSQTILGYYSVATAQCNMANYAFGQTTCCNNAVWPNGTGSSCDLPNYLGQLFSWLDLFTGMKSAQSVLQHFGKVDSSYRPWAVDLTTLQDQIKMKRPWLMGWIWTGGISGHALLGYGLSGTMVSYMDPWPSRTRLNILDYSSVKQSSDHTWSNTVLMNVKGITFVIDDTGSMSDNIDAAKAAAIKVLDDNAAAGKHFLYTLITFKDGDGVVRGQSVDPTPIKTLIQGLSASGGDGCPESSLTAVRQAANLVPNSEIYLMTDADSNSYGVDYTYATAGEVLYTAYILGINGVSLNGIIFGDCTSSYSAAAMSHSTSSASHSTARARDPLLQPGCNAPVNVVAHSGPRALSSSSTSSINSGAGGFEYLSQVSGGLFFEIGVGDTSTATDMILRHASMNSTVAVFDGTVPAIYHAPVDSTISALQIALNSPISYGHAIYITDPNGIPITGTTSGVSVTNLGSNTSYMIVPPALTSGNWRIAVSGTGAYRLSVTASTTNALDYVGDTSVAVGSILNMQAGFVESVGNVTFGLTAPDGSATTPVTLYDDGLHGDGHAGDWVFAGARAMSTVGSYRFTATGSGFFQRMYPSLIAVGYVNVVAPAPTTVLPGAGSSRTFVIKNLGVTQDTYNVFASSSLHWGDLSTVPATVTISPGGSVTVTIQVRAPATAVPGQTDVLTVEAISQTDSSINSTGTTQTIARSAALGDVNGDGVVDCSDIAIVKAAFGKKAGQPGFDPRADVVPDGVIDVRDLAFVSQHLPTGTRCP